MPDTLVPCPGCARHVRSTDGTCPFCARRLSDSDGFAVAAAALEWRARVVARQGRLSRAAVVAFTGTLAVAGPAFALEGCSSDATTPSPVDTGPPDFGAPAYGGSPDTGPPDFGAPAYGGSPDTGSTDASETDGDAPTDAKPAG